MLSYKTEQEEFWAGDFGEKYTERNNDANIVCSNISIFSKIFNRTKNVKSCLELGANRGLNLLAISNLIPDINMKAIEINEVAAEKCSKIPNVEVFKGSILDYQIESETYDLTFTKGVLIHIAPEKLENIYEILYKSSKKYIMVAEYYNPTPVELNYRGNTGKLFKRDFAGEILDKYPDLELIDYGFIYHRDYNFPQDDMTWFLMEKKS
ncbi:MAG: pseudaminic acid biosynthesis-associated methylase [Methanobrevibacter thaueri]|nr:pseudaminic acid biosynthesis-associated methylase [Methanobrevibacter thaueri]